MFVPIKQSKISNESIPDNISIRPKQNGICGYDCHKDLFVEIENISPSI